MTTGSMADYAAAPSKTITWRVHQWVRCIFFHSVTNTIFFTNNKTSLFYFWKQQKKKNNTSKVFFTNYKPSSFPLFFWGFLCWIHHLFMKVQLIYFITYFVTKFIKGPIFEVHLKPPQKIRASHDYSLLYRIVCHQLPCECKDNASGRCNCISL